jgi:hypothetical protein
MKKLVIVVIVVAVLVPLVIAPFTFRDQIQGLLDFLLGNSADQSEDSNGEVYFANTSIPRVLNLTSCSAFVTPDDAMVTALRDEILQDSLAVLTPDWMKFRDWVGNRIDYKNDVDVHGEREFWQFPNETIQLETGDCEDFSLLLCSLLRSNGWETDSVYVVVGERADQYHAWVTLFWNDYQYNIEPQGSGFDMIIGDVTYLSGYQAICYFNDQEFGTY